MHPRFAFEAYSNNHCHPPSHFGFENWERPAAPGNTNSKLKSCWEARVLIREAETCKIPARRDIRSLLRQKQTLFSIWPAIYQMWNWHGPDSLDTIYKICRGTYCPFVKAILETDMWHAPKNSGYKRRAAKKFHLVKKSLFEDVIFPYR